MRRQLLIQLLIIDYAPFVLYRRVPRQLDWCDNVLPNLDDDRFQSVTGLLKSTFLKLSNAIKNAAQFKGRDQFPVQLQLAITLYRLRTSESRIKVAASFGIGDGATIQRITKRVFDAIINLQLIQWPTQDEKVQLIAESRQTLPYCLGVVDGSMSPLKFKPSLNGRFYSTYKKNYAVKWQVTCDMNKRVRHLKAVVYGSIHDSTVFKATKLYQRPELYFRNQEYIIGDSAYPLSPTCVTPYKTNTRFVTAEHRRRFNKLFSKYRVRVEHCIGEIKKRFPSLEMLPIKIRSNDDRDFCCRWVSVAVMIHNFAIDYDDPVMYDCNELVDVDLLPPVPGDDVEENGTNTTTGEQKRRWLFQQMFESDQL